jgi:hypothetical protein
MSTKDIPKIKKGSKSKTVVVSYKDILASIFDSQIFFYLIPVQIFRYLIRRSFYIWFADLLLLASSSNLSIFDSQIFFYWIPVQIFRYLIQKCFYIRFADLLLLDSSSDLSLLDFTDLSIFESQICFYWSVDFQYVFWKIERCSISTNYD